jgi:hypothetical protein
MHTRALGSIHSTDAWSGRMRRSTRSVAHDTVAMVEMPSRS